jgi:hypothetical protein
MNGNPATWQLPQHKCNFNSPEFVLFNKQQQQRSAIVFWNVDGANTCRLFVGLKQCDDNNSE